MSLFKHLSSAMSCRNNPTLTPCCEHTDHLTSTHLLDHADELGEGPVELVEDTVEEGGGHVFVQTKQLRHVSLQQQ